MKRPEKDIPLTTTDQLIIALGFIGLATLIGIPAYYYSVLPDSIPRHFDSSGMPDAYSGKGVIWVLPIIGSLLFIGMHWLSYHPHTFNYIVPITEENAEEQYTIAVRMIRTLNTVIVGLFAYIAYATAQVALERQQGLGSYFLPVFLLLVFGTIGYFIWRSAKAA